MPPPKRSEADAERDFEIRRLTDGIELLSDQVEKLSDSTRSNREEILVLKVKLGFVATVAGLIGGGAVTGVVKLLTH